MKRVPTGIQFNPTPIKEERDEEYSHNESISPEKEITPTMPTQLRSRYQEPNPKIYPNRERRPIEFWGKY